MISLFISCAPSTDVRVLVYRSTFGANSQLTTNNSVICDSTFRRHTLYSLKYGLAVTHIELRFSVFCEECAAVYFDDLLLANNDMSGTYSMVSTGLGPHRVAFHLNDTIVTSTYTFSSAIADPTGIGSFLVIDNTLDPASMTYVYASSFLPLFSELSPWTMYFNIYFPQLGSSVVSGVVADSFENIVTLNADHLLIFGQPFEIGWELDDGFSSLRRQHS